MREDNLSPLLGTMVLRRLKQRLGRFIFRHMPITRHLFNHLRWELRAVWVRVNSKFNPWQIYRIKKICSKTGLSVDIACSGTGRQGWVNVDLLAHKNLTLRYDCRRGLPFKDSSVERIRCEHFLEHLDYAQEAPYFLASCFRVLKQGGVLRIIVPDAERFLRAYQSASPADWSALGWDLNNLPEGFKTQMNIINHVFRQQEEHSYAYDFKTLLLLLRQAGFSRVEKSEFGVSLDPMLVFDQPVHRLYSLYVDAVK